MRDATIPEEPSHVHLQSHPQHDIAAKQMNFNGSGYGGMMCVRLKIAHAEDALGVMRAFVAALRVVEVTCDA
jgi:cystathionine beta-lyase/cystathionine gamma-synthase